MDKHSKKSRKKAVKDFEEKVIQIRRVTKVVKGGRKMGFTALVVVGDKQGKVGLGLGKANEVKEAVSKGVEQARKSMVTITLIDGTIPFEIKHKFKSAKVLMRPAGEGTGLISGGAVRIVLELAGVKNVLSKRYGSTNAINNAYATLEGLKNLSKNAELFELRMKKA